MPRKSKEPNPWGPSWLREEKFSPMDLFTRSLALLVANELGVFECLSDGPLSLSEIATRLKTDSKGTRILLDALVVLNYLVKTGAEYRNAPDSARFLTRASPEYIGTRLSHSYEGLVRWLRLEDLLRKGQKYKHKLPEFQRDEAEERRRSRSFALGLAQSSRKTAQKIANMLDLSDVDKLLDLGGGAGTYSIAFARKWPKLRPVLFELPVPAKVARQQIKKERFADRISIRAGDFLKDDLGQEAYDAVFMSNIIHIYSPETNRKLLRKVYRALRSGGRIFVKDLMVNDDRSGPFYPVMFALTMLMFTEEGDTYSASEVKGWLKELGFSRIKYQTVIPHESYLVTANKS
ncbi:MAG: methyltransferase [Candidatus Abyssubacteria bacterium]